MLLALKQLKVFFFIRPNSPYIIFKRLSFTSLTIAVFSCYSVGREGGTYKAKRMIYTTIISYEYFMSTGYTQKLELIYFRGR